VRAHHDADDARNRRRVHVGPAGTAHQLTHVMAASVGVGGKLELNKSQNELIEE